MNSPAKFALAALLVLSIGASLVLYQKYHETTTALATERSQNEATRGQYADAIGSIASIQDSLNLIVLGDAAVRLTPNGYEAERNLTQPAADRVMERISVLRAGIERSKARIDELAAHLKKSGMKIQGLETMIASLKRTVAKKEMQIADLTGQVASLNTQVTGLTASVEEQKHELGTVYVRMGDKKDLTSSGVVVATGGVLGLGKTLKPTGLVDESLCTAINTDEQTTLDIPAKRALVLTAQPASSYALEPAGDHTVLRIIDPKEFRKVRHLVILTKTA